MSNLRLLDGATDDKRTSDLDRHIGTRLRERRILLGMTQQELGNLIGVTPQQMHKYEAGRDCITVARLWALAGALGVGVNYFFHRVGEEPFEGSARQQRLLLELCRHFTRINRPEHRASICEMVRALSSAEPASANELATK